MSHVLRMQRNSYEICCCTVCTNFGCNCLIALRPSTSTAYHSPCTGNSQQQKLLCFKHYDANVSFAI